MDIACVSGMCLRFALASSTYAFSFRLKFNNKTVSEESYNYVKLATHSNNKDYSTDLKLKLRNLLNESQLLEEYNDDLTDFDFDGCFENE